MTESAITEIIAGQQYFRGLDPAFIEVLAGHATERDLDKDEVLFHQGAEAGAFYIVREGFIAIEVPAIEGPPLELQRLGADALLGWSWLIPPYRWSFQARADEPARLVEFDGRAIRERCEQDPQLGYEIFRRFARLMSERLEEARVRMIEEWRPDGFA